MVFLVQRKPDLNPLILHQKEEETHQEERSTETAAHQPIEMDGCTHSSTVGITSLETGGADKGENNREPSL